MEGICWVYMIKNEFLFKGELIVFGIKIFEEGGGGVFFLSICGINRIIRNVFYFFLCYIFFYKIIICFVLNFKVDNFNVFMYSGCGG